MLGLGDYQSSEEEEEVSKENGASNKQPHHISTNNRSPQEQQPLGPTNGPSEPPLLDPKLNDGNTNEDEVDAATASASASPYTANRQLIHSLTLPIVPNVMIPPSPPGSPRASTSTKIQRFLELKTKGVHFNSKLAASSQLKNPSLFQNLSQFAGIDDDQGQYVSTLPDDLAPLPKGGFPRSILWDQLNKAQQDRWRRKEIDKTRGKRDTMNFVSGGSAQSSQSSTPHGTISNKQRAKSSAAERVMAGVGREKSSSPFATSDGFRNQRRSRFDDPHHAQEKRRSRSRSPKRRTDR